MIAFTINNVYRSATTKRACQKQLVKCVELIRSSAPKAAEHQGSVAVTSLALEVAKKHSTITKAVYLFY